MSNRQKHADALRRACYYRKGVWTLDNLSNTQVLNLEKWKIIQLPED